MAPLRDEFQGHLVDLQLALVRGRLERMLHGWRQAPNTPKAFIDTLEGAGLPATAAALRELFAAG